MNLNNNSAVKVTIIVNSCDAYSDLWDMFFLCLAEYWPECTYPIVLNTEHKNYYQSIDINFDIRVHNFDSGAVDLWGMRLISTLKETNSTYVIMLYDDFLLNAPVDHRRIEALLNLMSGTPSVDVVYLTKLPGVNKGPKNENGLALLEQGADYRLNSAPAIWRRNKLLQFTSKKDNPWAWEYFGSYRTFRVPSVFLAIADSGEDIYPYDYRKGGAIYRGKWVLEVINPIIKKYKLKINTVERGIVASNYFPKRNLQWKILFMTTGIQMIGPRILHVVCRISKRKIIVFYNYYIKLFKIKKFKNI